MEADSLDAIEAKLDRMSDLIFHLIEQNKVVADTDVTH